VLISLSSALAAGQVSVTTYHNDNNRTGWNQQETVLTPATVASSSFELLQTVTLDDQVDAQPLYMPGVNITAGNYQGIHNVVYVVTESDTVFAIDAQSGTILLNPNFGPPVPRPLQCGNPGTNVGINSTPVIDPTSNTLYVMVYTNTASGPAYFIHALDLGSLTDKVTPQVVVASHTLTNGMTFNFNATYQRQRPALLLANGNVYAGFGSFCDYAPSLSRGWLLGWSTGSLTPLPANQLMDTQATSPNTFFLASIWMSGYGPSTDDSGNVLFVTGNSDPSGTTYDGVTNIQESTVKVSSDLTTVLDLFTPKNQPILDKEDDDFGSGGVLVLPDQPGSIPHLAVAAGKTGQMFLMNEDSLGGYSTTTNNVLGTYNAGPCWCGESYFMSARGPHIVTSGGGTVKVWSLSTSSSPTLKEMTASTTINVGQHPGFFTSVSSNGTATPIVWALSHPLSPKEPNIYLYALNPNSGEKMTQLFSGLAGTWPNYGGNSNLVPVVANGEVFVASYKQLAIFGTTTAKSRINQTRVNITKTKTK
jgi:hypothetical protein